MQANPKSTFFSTEDILGSPIKLFKHSSCGINIVPLNDTKTSSFQELSQSPKTQMCSADVREKTIMQWFSLKNITLGNPEDLIQKHRKQQSSKVRQLSGNGEFLARLNIQRSNLLQKRQQPSRNERQNK